MRKNYTHRSKSTISSNVISYGAIVLAVLIFLKVVGFIDWSWWWVISPMWIIEGVVFIVLSVILGFYKPVREVRGKIQLSWIVMLIFIVLTISGLILFA